MTWQNLIWRAAPLLLIIMLTSYFAVGWGAIPSALVAWGTILLAYATFSLIKENRRIRDEDRKLDAKSRSLDEITEWASNVAKSAIYRQRTESSALLKTKLEYKYHKSKGRYIGEIVSSSFKELSDSFNEINDKLDEAIKFTEQIIIDRRSNVADLKYYETAISVSAEKLLEKTAGIKTRDIRKKEENMSKEGEATGNSKPNMKDIEEHLKRLGRQMQWQWLCSLGVSAMAVGLTWVIATTPRTPGDLRTGLFVFSIGLVISLIAFFYRYRKKS